MEFTNLEKQTEINREIFEKAASEDGWDVAGEMLYSYYFVDKDEEKLEKLGIEMEAEGYDFIDIFELADADTEESTGEFLLHLDKIETHTPESLAERNAAFQAKADELGLDSFDGWEFGEVGEYDEEEDEE